MVCSEKQKKNLIGDRRGVTIVLGTYFWKITELFKWFNTNIYKSMFLYQLKILISIDNFFDELIYYQENTF